MLRRTIGIFLASIALVAVSAMAQESARTAVPVKDAAVKTADYSKCFQVVGTSDFYFGTIDPNAPVTHTFEFKNTCSDTIEIDRAQASCGCTAAILSNKTVFPGAEAKIEVKFNPPRGSRGKVSKTVSVYLKGESTPHTVLRFSAEIKTDLDIQPQYVNLLGAEVGKESVGKATVKNMTDKDIEVTEIPFSVTSYADTSKSEPGKSVAIPLKNASVEPTAFSLKPGETKELTIKVTPEYKGQVNGSLRVKTEKNETYLQVFGIVREKGAADAGMNKQ